MKRLPFNRTTLLFLLFVLLQMAPMAMAQTPSFSQVGSPQGAKLALDQAPAKRSFSSKQLVLPTESYNGQETVFETTEFLLKDANPEVDPYGFQHYHYVQTINGIEVDGAEMKVHVKNGAIEDYSGFWLLEVSPALRQLKPTQSLNQLLAVVEQSLTGKKLLSHDLVNPHNGLEKSGPTGIPDDAKLVYVPINRDFENLSSDSVRLAYRFIVKTSGLGKYMYYIDATNGKLLYKVNMVCRIMGHREHTHSDDCTTQRATGAIAANVPPTETPDRGSTLFTMYSGRRFTTTTKHSDGKWSLKDLDRNIEVIKLDSIDYKNLELVLSSIFNTSNQWRVFSPSDQNGYFNDALWGAQQTYDFYKSTFKEWKYKSDDGTNDLIVAANLDFTLLDFPNSINAFYDGSYVYIGLGDPDNGINPLSSLDIVAHEVTHGVTAGTSGLQYLNESGAINESISDIFGTAVEHNKRPERKDWTLGEDIGLIIRSMSNPNAYEQPSEYGGKYFFDYGASEGDNGGVHVNSGIMNRWFYLLCEGGNGVNQVGRTYAVQKIGMDDALKILYYAQKNYLTPSMNFVNASEVIYKAAEVIFGKSSQQAKQVMNAWEAVNVSRSLHRKTCTDVHEPNNDWKAATQINTDKAISGNLKDFATSMYNRGELDFGSTNYVPNGERFSDWYVFTTTDQKPNFQIELKSHFADDIFIEIYHDSVNENGSLGAFGNESNPYYNRSVVDPKSQTISLLLPPVNSPKKDRYYIKIEYGYPYATYPIYQAISEFSDGCYEFTIKTQSKPIDIQGFGKGSALYFREILKRPFLAMNENSNETRVYKFLSLVDDKQFQTKSKIVQRNYDHFGDQIWQLVNSELIEGTDGFYHLRGVIKNLNTDKVLERSNEFVIQSDLNLNNPAQKFEIHFADAGDNFSTSFDFRNVDEYLAVTDTLSKSWVKCVPKGKEGSQGSNFWKIFEAPLPESGEYIVRSAKTNLTLQLSNSSGITTGDYTEKGEQRWKFYYDNTGKYVLTNSANNLALNLPNGNSGDNVSYDFQGRNKNVPSQNFKILPTGKDGSFKIVNSVSNKPLTLYADKSVKQKSYTATADQKWYLDRVQTLKKGYYYIQNRATSLYINVVAGDQTDGAKLATYPYRGVYNQLFYVEPQPDGSFIIEAVHSKKALSTNSTQDNFNLYQWTTDRTKINHKWRIVYTSDGYFKIISAFNGKAAQAGTSPNAAGSNSPLVQSTFQLNNFFQQWKFQQLGSVPNGSVQTLTGTESEGIIPTQLEGDAMKVYPNPAQTQITIAYALEQDESANISLYDLLGKQILTQQTSNHQTTIDLPSLPDGVYLVQLKSSLGKKQTQKLIVTK